MKKVSAKVFFTVLWRGVCQVLGWFFGLFGYKRDGKFAKCVWGLFATSASLITATVALVIVCVVAENVHERYIRGHHCDVVDCHHSEYISRNIFFHNTEDGKGYIYNSQTGEKTLKHVAWIAQPLGGDSLICFSNGKKRGYFSKYTGKVVVEPKYDHAWIFSEGLASIEENGVVNFIDGTGKVALNLELPYCNGMDGYVFHGGYCIICSDALDAFGLIDKTGKTVLPCLYDNIKTTDYPDRWILRKGKEMAVVNKELQPVMPFMECNIYVYDGMIDVIMPDHTIRKYNLQGELINDFYMTDVYMLEYDKEEILYRSQKTSNDDNESPTSVVEAYHPKATARLRAYVAGDSRMGLITAEGHIVTMPNYQGIEALEHDLYLCTTECGEKVIVTGKGEIVKQVIRKTEI
jgi:hypothetical protein